MEEGEEVAGDKHPPCWHTMSPSRAQVQQRLSGKQLPHLASEALKLATL